MRDESQRITVKSLALGSAGQRLSTSLQTALAAELFATLPFRTWPLSDQQHATLRSQTSRDLLINLLALSLRCWTCRLSPGSHLWSLGARLEAYHSDAARRLLWACSSSSPQLSSPWRSKPVRSRRRISPTDLPAGPGSNTLIPLTWSPRRGDWSSPVRNFRQPFT